MIELEQLETVSFAPANDAAEALDFLRIISWNINRGLQLNGILDFLTDASADLILLQEVDINARRTHHRNIAREIAHSLQMNYVFGCEFEELTQGDHHSPAYHGQATLSRLPITESRILRFRRQSGFWRPRWYIPNIPKFQRRLGARVALINHIVWSGKRLVLYNAHLESRGDDCLRCSQLAEILEDARRYGPNVPVVVAGDLNFDLTQEPAASVIARTPFNNTLWNGNVRPTTTESRLGRARAVDWVLTRGPLNYSQVELHQSVRASDHYPLSLVLKSKRTE
ncbi:MAG TPA: endonuclease/exonuclease/phosphatase family protein [Terriglobales bacterium]|nr:endonuclease/exonuclease/phosphatase family protein [Terriglobales bacterium]